jgi:hypothetical protein
VLPEQGEHFGLPGRNSSLSRHGLHPAVRVVDSVVVPVVRTDVARPRPGEA